MANFVTHAPVLAQAAKWAAGISRKRELPRFAAESFRHWFERRGAKAEEKPRVLLWPDTFNNYFLPQTARAAVEVLENAGCEVTIPRRPLCCGRPLYDYGMLAMAKQWLEETLEALGPEIEEGTPVVFLEPGCAAVFRDEMRSLLPDRADARRLSEQALLLEEYLKRIGYRPPRLERGALLHGHCHQKSLMGMNGTQEMLAGMGVKAELLDSGCCGMAGSFGYESGHYDISMKVGEHALLPRVREAAEESLIVADGFSCREQIEQGTKRRTMHLAEVLAMAIRPTGSETPRTQKPGSARWKAAAAVAGSVAASIAVGAAIPIAAALLLRRR